jgi:transposase-like protein
VTPKKRKDFLTCLSSGQSVAAACKTTGIARKTVYKWKQRDAQFAQDWDEAIDDGTDGLEDIALERAKKSSDRLLSFLLKARRPAKYRDQYVKAKDGPTDTFGPLSETMELVRKINAEFEPAEPVPESKSH